MQNTLQHPPCSQHPHAHCTARIARPLLNKHILPMEVHAVKQACLGHAMDVTHAMRETHHVRFHAKMLCYAGGQRPGGLRAVRVGRNGNCGSMVQPRCPTARPCATAAAAVSESSRALCAAWEQRPNRVLLPTDAFLHKCRRHERIMQFVPQTLRMPQMMQAAQQTRRIAPLCKRGATTRKKEGGVLRCSGGEIAFAPVPRTFCNVSCCVPLHNLFGCARAHEHMTMKFLGMTAYATRGFDMTHGSIVAASNAHAAAAFRSKHVAWIESMGQQSWSQCVRGCSHCSFLCHCRKRAKTARVLLASHALQTFCCTVLHDYGWHVVQGVRVCGDASVHTLHLPVHPKPPRFVPALSSTERRCGSSWQQGLAQVHVSMQTKGDMAQHGLPISSLERAYRHRGILHACGITHVDACTTSTPRVSTCRRAATCSACEPTATRSCSPDDDVFVEAVKSQRTFDVHSCTPFKSTLECRMTPFFPPA